MIIWDRSSTQTSPEAIALFYHHTLMGGKRAPVLADDDLNLLKELHQNTDANVMQLRSAMVSVVQTMFTNKINHLPWAVQYLKCDDQHKAL